MCKSSAARRLTEVIIIKKEGKILTLAKVYKKDFVARVSFQIALISELTLLSLNIGLGVSFQTLIITLRTGKSICRMRRRRRRRSQKSLL